MAVTWKLNGTEIGLLRLRGLLLEIANQAPDRLTFDDPSVAFDAEQSGSAVVDAITLSNAGTGYNSAPTVSLSGGGGTGAAATAALVAAPLSALTITNRGIDYDSAPTVSLSGGGGSGATAAATVGYGVISIPVASGGSGYTSAPTVTFGSWTFAPGGTTVATAVISGGVVTSIVINDPGNVSSWTTPTLVGGGGSSATCGSPSLGWLVRTLTITNAGTGYTSAPSVAFSHAYGTGAAATAQLNTTIASLTLTAPGAGYTSPPTVSFSGGGGSSAAAFCTLADTIAGLRWPLDTEITLTRTEPGVAGGLPVTWFRGYVRSTPRSADPTSEQIAYVVEGPWQFLERLPFLQNFKALDTGTNLLVDYLRGRTIIAQDDTGAKVELGAFLNDVLDYAIAAVPDVMDRDDFSAITGLAITIPWDEVVDLSCAEVIQRALQWVPDAVAWWDYAVSPPRLYINRRSALTAIELPILRPGTNLGDPYEAAVRAGFRLRERPDLQKAGVVLIYVKSNSYNGTAYETFEIDEYPVGTRADHPDTLVRTIHLAGANTNATILQQKVVTEPISSYLTNTSVVTSGSTFDSLSTWWKKHAPELNQSSVVIKGFRDGTRTNSSGGSPNTHCVRELVKGTITDWMEDNQNVVTEEQIVQVDCVVEFTDPDNPDLKERYTRRLSALITATSATTRTYIRTEATSFTPAEETPVGIAQAIYEAINALQFEGEILLQEAEPSIAVLVGRTINLTGGLETWETMAAIVQRARIDIERSETTITLGPPAHLGPDDLVELYRVNRNRQPVTSYWTRSAGTSGSAATVSGLPLWHPIRAGGTASRLPPRIFKTEVSVAGVVPTSTEVATALAYVYSGSDRPRSGDQVILTVSSAPKLAYKITSTNVGTSGIKAVTFAVDSIYYWAVLAQVGIY